ncbi:hypothetical protein [Desulfosporosinus sp. FKA]|uniref:hypothetical protein n=1 Tax=Desulfosporosinus sp. FKA TaxID=1969834 RepID=UPI000B49AC47|nr:hypothetical protein [Desulfosporosinus sp. FKA]
MGGGKAILTGNAAGLPLPNQRRSPNWEDEGCGICGSSGGKIKGAFLDALFVFLLQEIKGNYGIN